VDKLWDELWTGGISNPLTVIEQITFLMFIRLLDAREMTAQKQWQRTHPGKPFKGFYAAGEQKLRWSSFKNLGGEEMLRVVRDEVFPQLRKLGQGDTFGDFMKDATLVSIIEHLYEKYTSPAGLHKIEEDKQILLTYTGDQLSKEERKHIAANMLHGFDFDVTMLRIASMNLMLHGVDRPSIHYQDTLSNSFPDKDPKHAADAFDLVLANPPFKGSLDYSDVHPSLLKVVKTKKTELLFIALLLRMLKLGGRCTVIVPDGVVFGSSNAHVDLRKTLVEDNQLDAVIKLPAGVFKPYAGVSTAILIFTKGGKTTDVWYYDVQADGFSLDDKRDPVAENDLADVRERWGRRNPKKDTDRKGKAFFVAKKDIVEKGYDLSVNRYRETEYEEAQFDAPHIIMKRLRSLDEEVSRDMDELEALLK
jgi:type I restriction enzyme M protein